MIYLESSAVVKLARRETHTEDLITWLAERHDAPLVSSALVEIEVPRALRRVEPDALVSVPTILAGMYRVEINRPVRQAAGAFDQPNLRTLDAIHLATAEIIGSELAAFVSYDRRLLEVAHARGLRTASPGAGAGDS
ncbi:MAG: type II toxin-antitoxin system VapC family toxin [Candidatus Dormibacteraeota bacterium]|uniref:Ribonuclease VapC n=1 Tax=Candidatus Amunia macphersoniae TaxID=3127014 RepID=A0A934KKA8_9BACT|nr:type II toxin-antitoxin system VapC family toxin [Candidatus Dormibacteraeota bacterium]